jgi:short-subunit dehydrogenase
MHISSVAGQVIQISTPIYCATKAFVNHFVRAFAALQEEEKIRVVAVAPG